MEKDYTKIIRDTIDSMIITKGTACCTTKDTSLLCVGLCPMYKVCKSNGHEYSNNEEFCELRYNLALECTTAEHLLELLL